MSICDLYGVVCGYISLKREKIQTEIERHRETKRETEREESIVSKAISAKHRPPVCTLDLTFKLFVFTYPKHLFSQKEPRLILSSSRSTWFTAKL